jgi:DNA (cytosine-5)-methyltransferase 1
MLLNNPLKVATAFSGGFGSVEFALKYESISHKIIFAIEYAEPQRKSYINNHCEPLCEFAKDFKKFNSAKYFNKIDYYHLSPPCQSFSLAGNRNGLKDERGGLMLKAIESINEIQPKIFTIENVKGLLSANGGEDWKIILGLIRQLKNYSISYHILNAKDFGSPQNRERVFIVGFRAKVNFAGPQRITLNRDVFSVLENNIDEKYYISERKKLYFSKKDRSIPPLDSNSKVAPTILSCYGKRATDAITIKSDTLMQIGNIDTNGNNSLWGRVYNPQGIAPTQKAKGGGYGAKTGLFKLDDRIRYLTPRECARLQGDFEDLFDFGNFRDTRLYEFIGNAIDISTMRALINKMLKVSEGLKWNTPKPTKLKYSFMKQETLF